MSDLWLPAEQWLSSLRNEYLNTYVGEGGSAIKLAVVPSAEKRDSLRSALLQVARDAGYLAAEVSATNCKVHLIDKLYAEVARQVDWDTLVDGFLRRELAQIGLTVGTGDSIDVHTLADSNDTEVSLVLGAIRKMLASRLVGSYGLSHQFRMAMVQLCLAQTEADDLQCERAEHVKSWLSGELARVGVLRDAFIFRKVNRHSARTMLSSTAAFIRMAARPGILIVCDISRYAVAKATDDGFNRYSTAAALDMYEVLRQFVDGTDDVTGALIVFITCPEFLSDEQRGLRAYNALYLRLTDDVRDRRRPNPLAPMVRIGGS